MERWIGKTAVVTGASSGIGAETAEALVRNGLIVVGLARRVEKVSELASQLEGQSGQLFPMECDVTNEDDILRAFEWIENEFGGVDILINNAGVISSESIIEGSTEVFRELLDVNVLAVAICTREAVKSMRTHNVEGHIIFLNSTAGHNAKLFNFPVSLYSASKYAVTGMVLSLQGELAAIDANIKVTSVSPGMVNTQMPRNLGVTEEMLEMPISLEPKNVADAIVYALASPPNVQINELTIETLKKLS